MAEEVTVKRTRIFTERAPEPFGPYNQGIMVDNVLYISGQVGYDADSNSLVGDGKDVKYETRQTLHNIEKIVRKAGGTMTNIVKCTVLLKNIHDFAKVNEIYKSYFKDELTYPARVAYQVADLPKGANVEIEAIAYIGKMKNSSLDQTN